MKRGHFVEGLSNQQRLMGALRALDARGAMEASWLLVEGDAGYGKTNQLLRYHVQNRETSVFIRAKVNWTPNWMLSDLAEKLGVGDPNRRASTADLHRKILADMLKREKLSIIIDEFQHTAHKLNIIEQLRDLTDTAECILVASGNKGSFANLARYQQIRSRIYDVMPYGPGSLSDIKLLADQLCDVQLAPCLVERVHKETGGRLRDVLNALARIDAAMKTSRIPITSEAWGTKALSSNRPQLAVVSNG